MLTCGPRAFHSPGLRPWPPAVHIARSLMCLCTNLKRFTSPSQRPRLSLITRPSRLPLMSQPPLRHRLPPNGKLQLLHPRPRRLLSRWPRLRRQWLWRLRPLRLLEWRSSPSLRVRIMSGRLAIGAGMAAGSGSAAAMWFGRGPAPFGWEDIGGDTATAMSGSAAVGGSPL